MLPWHFIKAREEHRLVLMLFLLLSIWPAALGTIYVFLPWHTLAGLLPECGRQPTFYMFGFTAPLLEALCVQRHIRRIGHFPAHLRKTPESLLLSMLMTLTLYFLDIYGISQTVHESNCPYQGPFLMRVVLTFLHVRCNQLLPTPSFFC